MDTIDINTILARKTIEDNISKCINNNSVIYITGDYGTGKTHLVKQIVKALNYDLIYYDNTYNRNKQFISDILKSNNNNLNVYSMFYKVNKKNIIVLDDIDTINKSDKLAFNNLINILKIDYKSSKKNLNNNNNTIIFINNLSVDKKINELMKLCNVFEISKPSNQQIINILLQIYPDLFINDIFKTQQQVSIFKENLLKYINNSLTRLKLVIKYCKDGIIYNKFNGESLYKFSFEYNQKKIVQLMMCQYYNFNTINILNETNKTIVSLIFHENIVNLLSKLNHREFIDIYSKIIDNFSFSDYIDRNIFQKQLWQLNDVNFYIKILYNNYLLHKYNLLQFISYENIEFTKILTKYSNEYNNYIFLNSLYYKLFVSKHQLYSIFYKDKQKNNIEDIVTFYNIYDINKSDILRLYKFFNYID